MSTVNKFDLLAANWDAMPFVVNAAAHAAEIVGQQIQKMPNKPKLAMEFGCGTGLLGFMLADQFDKILGVDSSQGMVDQFNKKASDRGIADRVSALNVFLTSADQIPKQDIIFSNLAFHHVDNLTDMCTLLGQCLNPGGLLVVVDFEKNDHSVLFHPPDRAHDVFHHGIDTKDIERFAKAGNQFSHVEVVSPAFIVEKDTLEGPKQFPFFALVARKA